MLPSALRASPFRSWFPGNATRTYSLNRSAIDRHHGRRPQQGLDLLHTTEQPLVHIFSLDGHDTAFVLLIGGQLWIGLVHPGHEWMGIGVNVQHGIALDDLPRRSINPGIPQAGQSPGESIGAIETPPDIAARFPIRLVKGHGRNDAPLAIFPGIADRKSTRLNSSHITISYAVFCLKKK